MRYIPARLLSLFVGTLALGACNGVNAGGVLAQPVAASARQPDLGGVTEDRLYLSALPSVTQYAVSGNRHHSLCHDSLPPMKPYNWGGIGVNAAHVLYVPVPSLNKIFTFTADCGTAGPTLSDPNGKPSDVAFDNKSGVVYVSNFANPCVEVYDAGATSPTRSLCESGFPYGPYAVAVHGGDVYATMSKLCEDPNYQCFYLVQFPHGRQKGARVMPLSEAFFQNVVGITFDLKGNLLAFSAFGAVYIYPPPYRGDPGRACGVAFDANYYGALDGSNRLLYVESGDSVGVYTYPDCKLKYFIRSKYNNGAPIGIAVDTQSGG